MRIASVEAFPIRLQRNRQATQRTAGSPTALKAGDATYRWSTTVPALYSSFFETALIKISTSEGLTGWGESQAPLAPEVACTIVEHLLRPVLLGAEFFGGTNEIADLWNLMYRTMRVRGQTGGFMLDAISGVDIALWDLAGKIRGVSVSRLLSDSPRDTVAAYLSGVPGEGPEQRAMTVNQYRAEGFRTFKLFHEASPDELLSIFDAVSQMAGAGVRIAVDGLWRFEPETALAFGRELDRRNALWFEAPLAPESAEAHAHLARSLRTPIAIGESYRTRFEMAPFFVSGAIGFAQPDIGRTGITEGRRIANQAAQHGAVVIPHLSIALGPQIAAAIHFSAATEGCVSLEFNPAVLKTANQYLVKPLVLRNAQYLVPDGPGLGIDLLERELLEDCV